MNIPIEQISERILIGLSLKSNNEALSKMAEVMRPEHFFGEGHQEIVRIILDLNAQNAPVDYVSVSEHIEAMDKPHLKTWLLDAADRVAGMEDDPVGYHVTKILNAYRYRETLFRCQATIASFEKSTDFSEITDSHNSWIASLEADLGQETMKTSRQVCGQLRAQIKAAKDNPDGVCGIATGFEKLDLHTGGFRPGELIVVAARPGVGKSVFATQVLMASPYDPSALVTLEMTSVEIMARMVAGQSGTPLNQIRQGKFQATYDEDKVMSSIDHMAGAQIYFEDCPNLSISSLRSKIRRLHSKHGIKIAVIDYLQLVSATPGNRVREIGEISRGLKSLAKELKIPVVALAQLNRSAAEGEDPGLHHLRDSGEIEQDADIVILLHRKSVSEDDRRSGLFPTSIKIAKQRNGACVMFNSTLNGALSKFV